MRMSADGSSPRSAASAVSLKPPRAGWRPCLFEMNFHLLPTSSRHFVRLCLLFAVLVFGLGWTAAQAQEAQTAAPAKVEQAAAGTHDAKTPEHGPSSGHGADAHGHDAHAEHSLPPAAPVLFKLFGIFPVNSSMILTWAVALGIIAFAQYATRQVKEVPDGAQNFWEFLVEGLRNFLEGIIGRALTRKTFWFFATVFIFILFTNWFSLIPGVGTIGWGTPNAAGEIEHVSRPLLRGTNADLNMTLSMAIIFFACWIYWALKANGPGGFLLHIFGPRGEAKGFMKYLLIVVFALVGLLEVVSILFRPVSLSFRLYGNIFAGETMLEKMAALVPWAAPIIPIPFYFLELLVGLVQALVFMLLTAVFTLLICEHGDDHHSEPHAHDPKSAH
jgi:F-type H+-transporting ATPase subunit a